MKTVTLFFRIIAYVFIFMYELVVSSVQIARITLAPKLNFTSAAVRYSSKMKTRSELILITNSITLTPGTLVMDATLENGDVFVHVMSGDNVDQIRESLKDFPENKALWTLRG